MKKSWYHCVGYCCEETGLFLEFGNLGNFDKKTVNAASKT